MKIRILLSGLLSAACLFGAYSYEYNVAPSARSGFYTNTAYWTIHGTTPTWPSAAGYPSVFSSAGSVIWVPAITSGSNANDYEVNSTLNITANATFIHYLRANSTAYETSGGCTGSYVSVEVQVSSYVYLAGSAPATLVVHQCNSGSITSLGSQSISVATGSTLRTAIWGTTLWIFLNDQQVWTGTVSATTGQPGFGGWGMTSTGGFSQVQIGHRDTAAPSGPIATAVRSSVLPTQVSLAWQGAADDTNGIGVAGYNVTRNGTSLGYYEGAELGDSTVSAGTSYAYALTAVDFHGNTSTATSYTVVTPPAAAVDPRRVGIYNNGSYWGGAGEQIDMLSGNLNFSLPLVSAQGRTGWAVTAGLTYNSQNWRQESAVGGYFANWQLGADIGYGFGWKVQIGSITPYYLPWPGGADHYIFTDGTGAEYRLDQHSGSIWSSIQGIYVWFDAGANVLHFKDGSFWVMGDVSSGAERDAGTLYPTVLEDVSGNQVIVTYLAADSVPGSASNTSGRISAIQGVQSGGYTFTYNADATPHLTQVQQSGTSNSIALTYTTGVTLFPPFGGSDPNYTGLTTTHLASVTPAVTGNPYQFTYDSAGASELTEVDFPWGGYLRWNYLTQNYAAYSSGTRSLREVSAHVLWTGAGSASTYPIVHSDTYGAAIPVVHADATITDSSGVGAKKWVFNTSTTGPWPATGSATIGLPVSFTQLTGTTGSVLAKDTYTWNQSSSGNLYIGTKVALLDAASPVESAQTIQTVDGYGNLTQLKIYPYNNTTTPLKTYDMTYVTGSSYISGYVRNRLATVTLTVGGVPFTLLTNTYDNPGSLLACNTTHPCPTAQFDPLGPINPAYRGLVTGSATMSNTITNTYLGYGAIYTSVDSMGNSLTNAISSTTNYAAPDAITTQSYSTALSYNTWTAVTQTTGVNGEQLNLTYDSYGRPATATSPYGTPGTPTVTYSYSGSGVTPVWQAKTGLDGYTKTTLDGLGRPIKIERGPDSGTIQSRMDTVYASVAGAPLAKLQKVSMPYAPGGTPVWTTYTYDGRGRALTIQKPDGASTATYSYAGNQTSVTDPAGIFKQFTNDAEGNLITVSEWNPAGGTTSYTYDWMNHIACVDMTRGGTSVSAYTYTSGGVTCVTTYTGGTRQTRTFVYDPLGRLTTATNPENGTVTYSYGVDNTLLQKTDAKGQVAVYAYDSQKRLTLSKWYPTGTSHAEDICQRVSYTYGTDSSSHNYGRLISKAYGSLSGPYYDRYGWSGACISGGRATAYTENYGYHPAGAVTGKSLAVTRVNMGGEGWAVAGTATTGVAYAYDGAGRIASTSYQVGGTGDTGWASDTFTYGYDSMGRPVSLTDQYWAYVWGTGVTLHTRNQVSGVTYDVGGRMTGLTRFMNTTLGCDSDDNEYPIDNFIAESRGYNILGQMTSKQFSSSSAYCWEWLGSSGTDYDLWSGGLQYTFSATQNNGQITQMQDTSGSASGENVSYQYDGLKRLTQASATPIAGGMPAGWTQTYGYDGFGNMTSKVLTGGSNTVPSIDPVTNRMTTGSDANGNMLSGAGLTLTYDEANRVTSATPISGGTEWFAYAPDNKRIYSMNSGGGETYTFYGAKGENLGTYNWYDPMGGDCITECRLLASTANVWFAGMKVRGATFTDRLGTERNGTRTRPYGETVTSGTVDFATYPADSFSALHYADQRYYASSYGRFNTADPYQASGGPADPGSWNRYAYVQGDPINHYDPQGLMAKDVCTFDASSGDGSCDDGGPSYSAGGGNPNCTGSTVSGFNPLDPNAPTTMNCYGVGISGSPVFTTYNPPEITCEETEIGFVSDYLTKRKSPLAAFAAQIVSESDAAGWDDRFIVALAGRETTYGTNPNWNSASAGLYNVFSNSQHCATVGPAPANLSMCKVVNPYSGYGAAITDTISTLGSAYYSGLNSADDIYNEYNFGKAAGPDQILHDIIQGPLKGNLGNERGARCP